MIDTGLQPAPSTGPAVTSEIDAVSFRETQIKNNDGSSVMRGFLVSSSSVTAKANVVLGPSEFDKMVPGGTLVSPLTTQAWTQLFSNAFGLVSDVSSSILARGYIVAREYGIPEMLDEGNGTRRIRHGQTITSDGDAGTGLIRDEDTPSL